MRDATAVRSVRKSCANPSLRAEKHTAVYLAQYKSASDCIVYQIPVYDLAQLRHVG